MSVVNRTGQRVDIIDDVGDTITLTGPVTNADGTNFEWAGATTEASVRRSLAAASEVIASFSVDTSTDGEITLTLSAEETAGMGCGKWWWALRVTQGGQPSTWIAGVIELVETANG